MRQYLYILALSIVLSGCIQSKKMITYNKCNISLYTSLGDTGDKFKERLAKDGVKKILFVNGGHYIDPDFDGIVNVDVLETFLKKYGNPSDSTVVVLNWEGDPFKCLYNCEANSIEFKNTVQQYKIGYEIVKKYLPHSLVGYYALPFRAYWSRDEVWKKTNEKIYPLLSILDVLYPSMYDFYEDTLPFNIDGKSDLAYLEDNVKEAVKVGELLNKPVIPFIWHRMHESNERLYRELIPPNDFYRHVKGIVDRDINGKKIDGLVWWSSEDYFYRIKDAEFGKENILDFDEYMAKTGNVYFNLIKKAIEESCRN